MIAIIDYGAGNLHSVQNALTYLGADCVVTGDRDTILSADKVILPGVGSFGDAMANLRANNLEKTVCDAANSGKPFLGICLGLHLLFDSSEESEGVSGLSILKGKVKRIPDNKGLKIPHIGWNSITINKTSRILKNIGDNPFVYFVHSYYPCFDNKEEISAYTEYGTRLDIAVEKGNIFATQFHPEKSGKIGLKILKNFIEL